MTLTRNGMAHIKVYAIKLTKKSNGKVSWFKACPTWAMQAHKLIYSKNPESKELKAILQNIHSWIEGQGYDAEIAPKWIWYDTTASLTHSGEVL